MVSFCWPCTESSCPDITQTARTCQISHPAWSRITAELRSCLPQHLQLRSPQSKTQITVSARQISNWALKLPGGAEMTFKMAGGHSAQGHRHGPKTPETIAALPASLCMGLTPHLSCPHLLFPHQQKGITFSSLRAESLH